MGMYEDLFYEIATTIDKEGLRSQFEAQLDKMKTQDKHRYKETRDRWEYAYKKVIEKHGKKTKIQ